MPAYIKANLTGFLLMLIASITVNDIPILASVLLLLLSLMFYVQAIVYTFESKEPHEED